VVHQLELITDMLGTPAPEVIAKARPAGACFGRAGPRAPAGPPACPRRSVHAEPGPGARRCATRRRGAS